MATNTGHHLTHVSLFTQIYIAVATIYPGWPPLKALFRQRLTLVDSGAIPERQYHRYWCRLPVAPGNSSDGINEVRHFCNPGSIFCLHIVVLSSLLLSISTAMMCPAWMSSSF